MHPDSVFYFSDAAVDQRGRAAAAAVIVRDRVRQILDYATCMLPGMTNNEAEYEALLLALELALERGEQRPVFLVDSQVVVGQVRGRFAVHDARLAVRQQQALLLLGQLPQPAIAFTPRIYNELADALAAETLRLGLRQQRTDHRAGRNGG